jgi:hypothetical protein
MSKMPRITVLVGLTIVVLMAASGGLVGAADPPYPTFGAATVDGDYDEWDTECPAGGPCDFFADMVNGRGELGARLYLRYDCPTGILYVLVKTEDAYPIVDPNDAEEHYVLLDNNKVVDAGSGNDGMPPDFTHILSGTKSVGWEASVYVGQGSHTIYVHTNVLFDGESQTAGTPGDPPLETCCNSITIIKEVYDRFGNPGGHPDDFDFCGTNPLGSFQLDDDFDPTLSDRRTFYNLTAGTYNVTETLPPPSGKWDYYGIECVDPTNNTTDNDLELATINLGPCEHVTCTFKNILSGGGTAVALSSFGAGSAMSTVTMLALGVALVLATGGLLWVRGRSA